MSAVLPDVTIPFKLKNEILKPQNETLKLQNETLKLQNETFSYYF